MFMELLIGITTFLVAKDRKESVTEMAVTAGLVGMLVGLLCGIILLVISPLLTMLFGLVGVEVSLTIVTMIMAVANAGVATILLSIIYSGLASAIFALLAVFFYWITKEIMTRIEL